MLTHKQPDNSDSIFETMAHRVIHPFGQMLKSVSPRSYQQARWGLSKFGLTKRIIRNPMSQHFLLPFAVRKGDTVFDIGANTGQFTIPLAQLVGSTGVVHSFEPISTTFKELKTTVEQESVSERVRLSQFALGDLTKSVSFTIPKERPTEATAIPHNTERWADFEREPENYFTETCRVMRLDDYLRENRVGDISFLKCDVEGGELQMMKGARSIFAGPNLPILMVEIFEGWTNNFGYEPRDLIRFLEKEAGYECFWINPLGLKQVKSDDATIPGIFFQWVDFLFVVPDVHAERINVERYISE